MTTRRIHQRQVMALLLALGALIIPIAGASLFGGFTTDTAFAFLGATSQYDFIPVLMLVGALGVLVITGADGDASRSSAATSAATVTVLAGGVLAVAYLGTAFHLRAGGAFAFGSSDDFGWSPLRAMAVASTTMIGVVCGAVAAYAVLWLREPPRKAHV